MHMKWNYFVTYYDNHYWVSYKCELHYNALLNSKCTLHQQHAPLVFWIHCSNFWMSRHHQNLVWGLPKHHVTHSRFSITDSCKSKCNCVMRVSLNVIYHIAKAVKYILHITVLYLKKQKTFFFKYCWIWE